MNAPVSIPVPTLDDLIRRAIEDHDAVLDIAHVEHLQPEGAHRIAARAVDAAIEDWLFDNGIADMPMLPALRETVFRRVIDAGWDARDAADQMDLFETQDIWSGAARHEARRELG